MPYGSDIFQAKLCPTDLCEVLSVAGHESFGKGFANRSVTGWRQRRLKEVESPQVFQPFRLLHTFVNDGGMPEFQAPELGHRLQADQGSIVDLGVIEFQSFEFGEPGQTLQPLAGDVIEGFDAGEHPEFHGIVRGPLIFRMLAAEAPA